MSDEPARRKNTDEEIRSLGASQGKVRNRGLVALVAGALTVAGAAAAVAMLSREKPAVVPPPAAAAEEPSTLRPELVPEPNAPTPVRPKPHKPIKDPIARLAAPVEVPRPSGATGPAQRPEPQAVLEDLARSLANQKRGAVQLCFERELKRDPHLRGNATVTIDLKAPHILARVFVQDSLHRPSFTHCVEQALRNVDFPHLGEDVSVEIPFALKAPDF
jgi:hypothetical protein